MTTDPAPVTNEQIAEWMRLADAATEGEWTVERYGDGDSLVIHYDEDNRVCFMATPGSRDDFRKITATANFIASSRTAVPALVSKVNEQAAEIERLRCCVERACNAIETLELGRRDAVLRLRAALPEER